MPFNTIYVKFELFFIFYQKMTKILYKFSDSKKVTITFSTFELFFILTSLLKLIRLDKSNFKFNYRVYKIIDKLILTINNI